MKTVQGFRHKCNFVVASPHAGFSNVTNNAAHSIFLIIPSSKHQLQIEKCCSGGVGLHLSFLPEVSGLIRSYTRRPPILDFRFCRRSAGVGYVLDSRGRAELVRRTSRRNVAMQVSNAFHQCPVHSMRVMSARKLTPLVTLAPTQRPLSILLLRCLENGPRTLGCPFQMTNVSGVI